MPRWTGPTDSEKQPGMPGRQYDDMSPDPREENLPAWARDILFGLRRQVKREQAEAAMYRDQLAELRDAVSQSFGGGTGDTAMHDKETGMKVPLPDGAVIEFGDFVTAQWGVHADSDGQAALAIESSSTGQFVVAPTSFGARILIMKRTATP